MAMPSIRRMLYFGVATILVVLAILTAGTWRVLSLYDQLVNDLDRTVNDVPHRDDLLAAAYKWRLSVAALDESTGIATSGKDRPGAETESFPQQRAEIPLSPPLSNGIGQEWRDLVYEPLRRAKLEDADDKLNRLRDELTDFKAKLHKLVDGGNNELNALVVALIRGIDNQVEELDRRLNELRDPSVYRAKLADTRALADRLVTSIEDLPDPVGNLTLPIDRLRRVYDTGTTILWWTAGVAFVLMIVLMRCGYRWIFRPLRLLYDGTSRVAQGDFDYRVKLDRKDEIGELADAFNNMTIRFQEVKQDLDRQVRQRVKQLIRSERLAGIGFLATGVAHEINTPLTGILGAAQAILDQKEEFLANLTEEQRQDLTDYLDIMREASRQCRAITDRLLQFARGEDARGEAPIRQEVDLAELVREVLHMVSHMSRFRHCKINFNHPGPCLILANGTEIKQVILNLVANGLDAMPNGGTITVEIVETLDQVELRISDEGIGMTPDVIEHLFEPFYTQNKPGKGTGLGMAITHQIVSSHGGTIEPKSDGQGQGSTFLVHLPRHGNALKAA